MPSDMSQTPPKNVLKRTIIQEISRLLTDGSSKREAAKMIAEKYGLKFERVRKWILGDFARKLKSHDNQMLTDAEEQILLGWIVAHSQANRPLTPSFIALAAKKVFRTKKHGSLRGWTASFLERHDAYLTQRKGHEMKPDRLGDKVLNDIDEWVEYFPSWVHENDINQDWIINADETRVLLPAGQKGPKVVVERAKIIAATQETIKNRAVTYIPFVASNGRRIMDVFVIPQQGQESAFFVNRKVRKLRSTTSTYYCFSENGYLDAGNWYHIIVELCKILKGLVKCGKPGLLLDNLGCHRTIELLRLYKTNKLNVCFFPPNCSHLLQPCDDKIFAVFKRKLHVAYWSKLIALKCTDRDAGQLLGSIALSVANDINENVIKASFLATGLVPWNPVLIKSRAQNLVKTASDPMEPLVEQCKAIFKTMIDDATPPKSQKRVRISGNHGQLYSAQDILDIAEKTALEKENAARQKE